MEWKTLKGSPCDRFRELVPAICMDLGVPEPATSADVDELYRRANLKESSFKKARADVKGRRMVRFAYARAMNGRSTSRPGDTTCW